MSESKPYLLARGEHSLVELGPGRQLIIHSGPVSIALDPEEFLDLCGTMVHGLQIYKEIRTHNPDG